MFFCESVNLLTFAVTAARFTVSVRSTSFAEVGKMLIFGNAVMHLSPYFDMPVCTYEYMRGGAGFCCMILGVCLNGFQPLQNCGGGVEAVDFAF